ncbi:MAG TPA: hypothetical protein VGC01_07710 [Mucilaginibacter sp.]
MKSIYKTQCVALLFMLPLLFTSCGTSTMITSSWRKPDATANGYRNVFVAAITSNIPVKQQVEDGLQQLLQQKGLTVEKSTDVFPPNFSAETGQKKDLAISRIRPTGADGILTITLLRKETESHYTGRTGWNPGFRYGYYNRFSDYYNNWYPYIYAPGYYEQDKVYYLETNLYDAKTEQLIWAAQSKTYDPINMQSFLKGYVQSISDQMVKDGLITPSNAKL